MLVTKALGLVLVASSALGIAPGLASEPAGTASNLTVTKTLDAQIRASYYDAYRDDPKPSSIFGVAPGRPESSVRQPYVHSAGVIYGSTSRSNSYWVVADICFNIPTGCEDIGAFQVFHRTGPSGDFAYGTFGLCDIPNPLANMWYTGGHYPMGVRCPNAAAAPRQSSPSATLDAAYRAARTERSFELLYDVPLALLGSSSSKPVFWVLQTKHASRAVEQYQLTVKGKLATTYVLFSAQQSCTWFAPGQAPPGSPKSATVPSCSGFNSSNYDSEIFSFLSLTGAHLTGPGEMAGTAVTGVAGNLAQSIDNVGSHTSMDWGPVTFWVATKTSLPVAVTASADGRRVVIFQYADWDSPAVRFPPGTPS